MGTAETGYAAAAAASLQQVARALEAYLCGRIDQQQLLRCMYTSAPGRRGFMQQAGAQSAAVSPPDSKQKTRPLASQLASFAALLCRMLGPAPREGSSKAEAAEGPPVLQQPEEVAHAGVCAAEFWLQHVQQLLSVEAATAAAAAAAGGAEANSDTAAVYREMENIVPCLAAVAADCALPLHTRKAGGEALLLLAVVALSGPQGACHGGPPPAEARGSCQSGAAKRRQMLRRVLRRALEGLLEASGGGAEGSAAVMREFAVTAAHTVLHWQGASRRSLRAALGPLGPALLQTAQQGALMRDEETAAIARSLLCRLTWIWRSTSKGAVAGDEGQQQQQQQQQSPFGVACLFSHVLNSAQQSVNALLEGPSSGAPPAEASRGPERFLLLRALQVIRDLLLYGGGQAMPPQGAVSTALGELEASGGRFLVLNVQRLASTIAAAAVSSWDAVREDIAAAAAGIALPQTQSAAAAAAAAVSPSAAGVQQQELAQHTQHIGGELSPQQLQMPRRGSKGSQKKWKRQMKLQQQQQQQQGQQQKEQQKQQQQNKRGPWAALVVPSSTESEESSEDAVSSEAEDSSDGGQRNSRRGPRGQRSSSNSSSSSATGAEAVQGLLARQLQGLQEAELSASSADTLEAAISAMGALVEVAGPGGLLPNLPVFCRLTDTLFNGSSPQLAKCILASRFGDSLVGFVRAVLRCCPPAAAALHRNCSRFAISVCRLLLAEDSSWQRAALVARGLAAVEEGGMPALLGDAQLRAAAAATHATSKKQKQNQQGGKGFSELSSQLSRRLSGEGAVASGLETAANEGQLLLIHGWRSLCCLLEELLRSQEKAVLGAPAQQLHAFVDALVVGILSSGLASQSSQGLLPVKFACVVVGDASALISALRLLSTSINLGLPPLATLRAVSCLQQRLGQVAASGCLLSACAGPSSALDWRLFEAEGGSSSSSSGSGSSGAALLQLRHSTAVSGGAAAGAVQAALTDLELAVRNAACARSTEGAAAAGEAAVEAGGEGGGAYRFLLRAEELSVLQETGSGVRVVCTAVYAASVASTLSLTGGGGPQKPRPCPAVEAPRKTSGSPAGAPLPANRPAMHRESAPVNACRSLEVADATPSKAASRAFLSAIGVSADSRTSPSPAVSASPPASPSSAAADAAAAEPAFTPTAAGQAEGCSQLQRKRQRENSKAANSSSAPGAKKSPERKSDDEVVILEEAAAPPPVRRSGGAAANRGAGQASCGSQTLSRDEELQQPMQQGLCQAAGSRQATEVAAETQARARLRQLLQSDYELSD
ncbi:hypothetical protein Efla_002978 [Eimeria flavescens]